MFPEKTQIKTLEIKSKNLTLASIQLKSHVC